MVALEDWDKPSKIWTNLRRIGVYAGITICSLFVLAFLINVIKSFFCKAKNGWGWNNGFIKPNNRLNGSFPIIHTVYRSIFTWITGGLGITGLILLPGHL
jgi:hypothetical protein